MRLHVPPGAERFNNSLSESLNIIFVFYPTATEVNGSVSPPNLITEERVYFSVKERHLPPLKTFNSEAKTSFREPVVETVFPMRGYPEKKILNENFYVHNPLLFLNKLVVGSGNYGALQ